MRYQNKYDNYRYFFCHYAFSMAEILMAMGILAFCLLPVMNMMQSANAKTSFSEYQLFAHIRAARIMEIFAAWPYEELLKASLNATNQIPSSSQEPPMPDEYRRKLAEDGFQEFFAFYPDAKKGLGLLEVQIQWRFPGPDQEWRSYILRQYVSQPELSLLQYGSLE